jgi:hypothetical protein
MITEFLQYLVKDRYTGSIGTPGGEGYVEMKEEPNNGGP